ncbi:MAG TPA: STM3941 family protein [Atopostipes sp.]|nr:STM3941 family protein [Atopostipes sp.]
METLSYDHSRASLLPMLILGFIMFAASVFLLYLGLETDFILPQIGLATSTFSILAGGFGTLFFGFAFLFILYRFIFPKGALIITDRGIFDNTNAIGSKELIPFEGMKNAKLEIINATPCIGIDLHNEEDYLKKLPTIKRKAHELNKKYFKTSVISLNVPHESREELLEIIDIINERIEITSVRKKMNWIKESDKV